jgi:hypothetical protein
MLKKMSTAIALGLVVALLSIPAASFAGNGAGPGDGTGNDPQCIGGYIDENGDCICEDQLGGITTQGNFEVATGPNGSQTGDQDRLQDGSCLDEA